MKLHDTPLQHFCYHLDCNQRFLTQQELKEHVSTHRPFRPQCQFTDCEKLFPSLQSVYDHEWRHYIPAPQRDELELRLSRQKRQNSEAPWKQKVKVEEIWLQSKTGHKESPAHDHVEGLGQNKADDQPCDRSHHVDASHLEAVGEVRTDQPCKANVPDSNRDLSSSDGGSAETVQHEPADESTVCLNGYEDETISPVSCQADAGATTPKKIRRKKMPVTADPLNVRDLEDMSTLSEGVQQSLGEPHITEHKTFQPEDPSYATFVKAPFIRPPPSTYLDESVLSMRKRRSTDEQAPRKNVYWNTKKKETAPEIEEQRRNEALQKKARTRCDKCLSSFSSSEELQKHQALNTCSALFGFDSDDESK